MNQLVAGKLDTVASRWVMQPHLLRQLLREHGCRVFIIILFAENYGRGYPCINSPLQLKCEFHVGKNTDTPDGLKELERLLVVVDALNG